MAHGHGLEPTRPRLVNVPREEFSATYPSKRLLHESRRRIPPLYPTSFVRTVDMITNTRYQCRNYLLRSGIELCTRCARVEA